MSESLVFDESLEHAPAARRVDRWARRAVRARLETLAEGRLVVHDGGERFAAGGRAPGPEAALFVHRPRTWRRTLLGGVLGAAEAYMDGDWRSDDLVALVRLVARNRSAWGALGGASAGLARPLARGLHVLRRNSRRGSRRNIAAHYDLGNDLFALFLDPTLTYSAAVFDSPAQSLEDAQAAKYERICRKLDLRARDRVLEIGGGWGGFALHAAATRGCRVTTATISAEQHALARERVAAAGLADRVEVRLEDYRDLRGRYDRLVSIEMIEAVGHDHFEDFFRVCGERLEPDGAMALQAILHRDQDHAESLRSPDFIKRYIFPGGQLPSLGALSQALSAASDLRVTHFEDITPHYAETLRRWRKTFVARAGELPADRYDARFRAMWEFYLAYCEGGFHERVNSAAQIVLERPGCRRACLLGALPRTPGAASPGYST